MVKSKCEVTEVVTLSKSRDHPVLTHFQHGSIEPAGAEDMDCFRAKQDARKIVVAAVEHNVYTGELGQNFSAGLLRKFIGIRNKVTNKMRIVEVQECSMLSKHYDASRASTNSGRTAEQARKTMLTSFGGKAASKTIERKERMRINVDIVKGQLDKTMNDTLPSAVPEKDEFDHGTAEREEQQKAMLPKYNADATKLGDVYTLTELISADLLERLESDAHEVLKTSRDQLPIESVYLLDIIGRCQASKQPDSPANIELVKVCIYVDALITFQKKLRGVVDKQSRLSTFSNITEKVEVDIRRHFTQPATHKIAKTDYVIDKAIAYALILSLLIGDKFEQPVAQLVEALHISNTKLLQMANVLPVRTAQKGQIVGLKLPSKMRAVSRSFVRKRRA